MAYLSHLLRVVLALVVALLASAAMASTAQAATCDDYDTQAEAQRAADTRDADGDGVYCETLPCPCLDPRSSTGSGNSNDRPANRAQRIKARVIRVVDGDTIEVRAFGAKRKRYDVRLIGIDTPEVYGGTECGGPQASAYMKRIAKPRERVTLITDPTQDLFDRYDRLLAYVKPRGGALLQKRMLAAGWAKVYVYGGNPFQKVRSFRRAQRTAKRRDRGVWDRCNGDFHRGT